MVLCFGQIIFQHLLRVRKHVFNASLEEFSYVNSLFLWVLKLVSRNFFYDSTLVVGHRLENEGKSDLLVIVLGREELRSIHDLIFVVELVSVNLATYKVKIIHLVFSEDNRGFYVVY